MVYISEDKKEIIGEKEYVYSINASFNGSYYFSSNGYHKIFRSFH